MINLVREHIEVQNKIGQALVNLGKVLSEEEQEEDEEEDEDEEDEEED